MSPLLQQHRKLILALARKRGVKNVRVFGSFARGEENKESDLDLLVLMRNGKDLLDLIAFLEDVQEVMKRDVDVIDERGLKPYVRDKVLSEAIAL
jgi:uncharacterized protein